MKNSTPNGVQPQRLYVKVWIKAFMYGVCLLPVLLMSWVLWSQFGRSDGNIFVTAVICIIVVTPFGWLFTRLYSLCSIELDSEGVVQSFAFFHNDLGKRVHLRWDQIQNVSFSRHSYHFVGENGLEIELNTALFGDVEATIVTVRMFLPQRLLTQLGS